MTYKSSIAEEVKMTSKKCFCCGKKFQPDEYKAVHSMTGLHLELEETTTEPYRYVYRVTDPPKLYSFMMGRVLETDEYEFGFRYNADAVCLCNRCHKLVHAVALELCVLRIPEFRGNTPTPKLLIDATVNLRKYRKLPV